MQLGNSLVQVLFVFTNPLMPFLLKPNDSARIPIPPRWLSFRKASTQQAWLSWVKWVICSYLKAKIVVGEVSVIDNCRIQALRGITEKLTFWFLWSRIQVKQCCHCLIFPVPQIQWNRHYTRGKEGGNNRQVQTNTQCSLFLSSTAHSCWLHQEIQDIIKTGMQLPHKNMRLEQLEMRHQASPLPPLCTNTATSPSTFSHMK